MTGSEDRLPAPGEIPDAGRRSRRSGGTGEEVVDHSVNETQEEQVTGSDATELGTDASEDPAFGASTVEPGEMFRETPVVHVRPDESDDTAPTSGTMAGFNEWLAAVWCYTRFGVEWLVRYKLRARYQASNAALRSERQVQKIVAVANTKGGSGKTAVTAWMAAIYQKVVRRSTVAFDVNPGPGGTAKRLGVAREDTISLRQVIQANLDGKLDSTESFHRLVDYHAETGVSVITSDRASSVKIQRFNFTKTLRAVKKNVHMVFCDLGNTVDNYSDVGSVELAHTLVFPANVDMADSEDDLDATRELYSQKGHAEKVARGIVVILGASPRKRGMYAERYGLPVDQVFVIPHDGYMKAGKPVNTIRVPLHVQVILRELLVAVLRAEPVKSSDQLDAQDSPEAD